MLSVLVDKHWFGLFCWGVRIGGAFLGCLEARRGVVFSWFTEVSFLQVKTGKVFRWGTGECHVGARSAGGFLVRFLLVDTADWFFLVNKEECCSLVNTEEL